MPTKQPEAETPETTSLLPVGPVAPSHWDPIHPVLQDLPVAYVEVDFAGILRAVNRAACRMHHLSPEELVGHSIWEFVPA
ncbi:MAG TPA: PAS domain S-box protein, partial [Acidobacteriaceae bacterium]